MIRSVDPLVSLPAVDPARAHQFYSQTLGLETVMAAPESGFYIYKGPEGTSMIGVHRSETPPPAPDLDHAWIWLGVDAIAPVRARLEAAGVQFLGETRFLGPGFDAAFLDSEGNVLRLYEQLTEVRRSVDIAAPIEAVFAALTEPPVIERWFATIDDVRLEPVVGGGVSFVDPLFGRVTGRVTELSAPTRLAFAFDENWPSELAFTVTPLPDGRTHVEVVQRGFEPISDRDYGVPGLIERLEAGLATLAETAAKRATV